MSLWIAIIYEWVTKREGMGGGEYQTAGHDWGFSGLAILLLFFS